MITMPILNIAVDRARPTAVEAACPTAVATVCAPMFHAPTATTTNLWLDGASQGTGSGSKYAIKRIHPGRLRTET